MIDRRIHQLESEKHYHDEEQDRQIENLSESLQRYHSMAENNHRETNEELKRIEGKVDRLEDKIPELVTNKIVVYFNNQIASMVKKGWKWFWRFVIGGGIAAIVAALARFAVGVLL
jgi:predicted  nucleic acid-binding Zn-ribbon protein